MRQRQEEKGFSAWHLVLIFLVAVAVCGVFFSLGYVVGYNHRPARAFTETETVTPGGNIPPTVNAPQNASTNSLATESLPATPSMAPPAVRPKPQPETQEKANPVSKPVVITRTRKKFERKKTAPAKRQAEHPVVQRAAAVRRGRYAVQVIASRTRDDAVTLLRLLEARHYPVFLAPPTRGHSGRKLYRVQVGPFATRTQARKALRELEHDGFKPFVVHQ